MEFLYEPYFLSLLVAMICTCIYYLIEKNKQNDSLENDDFSKKNLDPSTNQRLTKKDEKQTKKSLSPVLKSILIFIISYSIFTGFFYAIKHYLFPKGNITISEDISIQEEGIQESINWLQKMQHLLPSISLSIPSILKSKEEEISVILRQKNYHFKHI